MNALVRLSLVDWVRACVCVYISLISVLVTLIGLSGWSIIPSNSGSILIHVFGCVLAFELALQVLVDVWVSTHSAAASNSLTSFSLSLALSGLFCCQCKLMPVMDYSRTGTNLSWHSQNSLPPYWDQLHRMLSPIVPYSEYTIPFSLSALHTKRPHSLTWTLP